MSFAMSIRSRVINALPWIVIAYGVIAYSFDLHVLGWWWPAYWLATCIVAGVIIGIPHGVITAWIYSTEEAFGRPTPFQRVFGYTWVLLAWAASLLIARQIAFWME